MENTSTASGNPRRGTARLLILAQIEVQSRHGYEISQCISDRTGGVVSFNVASLYPILYSMERNGLIVGKWVEKPGQRRRRYYRITAKGKKRLAAERESWNEFMQAVRQASGIGYA